ncbi:hypothetical protein ABZ249_30225 [Nocardiopsis sp. NPDC006139]|uniref:hypothetical protein n=1 Tax=Nocardiopsis sp. NPDC006139 TaxID=3154578 RepID=UPI0033B1C359
MEKSGPGDYFVADRATGRLLGRVCQWASGRWEARVKTEGRLNLVRHSMWDTRREATEAIWQHHKTTA